MVVAGDVAAAAAGDAVVADVQVTSVAARPGSLLVNTSERAQCAVDPRLP